MTDLLFIHGAGLDARFWTPLSQQLEGISALAIDLPAHGEAEFEKLPEGTHPSIEAYAHYICARHDLTAMTVIGHSMGALIAIAAAAQEKPKKLILLGAGAAMPVHADLLQTAKNDPDTAASLILKWGTAKENANARDFLLPIMQRNGAFLHDDLAACDAFRIADYADAIADVPVHIITSSGEKMVTQESVADLQKTFKNAQLSIIENSGHMIVPENPSAVAELLLRHI